MYCSYEGRNEKGYSNDDVIEMVGAQLGAKLQIYGHTFTNCLSTIDGECS